MLPTIACYPSTTRSITYSGQELREINVAIQHDKYYQILPLGAINTIRKLTINKSQISISSRTKS